MTRRLTIHTTHIKPPIPKRDHDWSAVTADYTAVVAATAAFWITIMQAMLGLI